jgi:protein tyrosine phosphatase
MEGEELLVAAATAAMMAAEYDQVVADTSPLSKATALCPIAIEDGNAWKNRYTDVLPTEMSRVRLTQPILVPGTTGSLPLVYPSSPTDGPDRYINASWMGWNRGDYIVTQAPMPCTFEDFWSMVWQEAVHVIVCLTAFSGVSKRNAQPYLPTDPLAEVGVAPQASHPPLPITLLYGDVYVTLTSVTNVPAGGYTLRTLSLRRAGETRTCNHYQYSDWPDGEAVSNPGKLVDLMRAVRQDSADIPPVARGRSYLIEPPILVHCSAGLGRSCTFVAAMIATDRRHVGTCCGDIKDIVRLLRTQRLGAVQTAAQYALISVLVDRYLKMEK